MFLEDKASGEIGTRIPHPLYASFYELLTDKLGDSDKWQSGDEIKMEVFKSIKNKNYVRNELTRLGFVLGKNINTYFYIAMPEKKRKEPVINGVEPVKLDPEVNHTLVVTRDLLNKHEAITTEGLTVKARRRVSTSIATLRHRYGLNIISKEIKDGRATRAVVYSLSKNEYIEPDTKPYSDFLSGSILKRLKSSDAITNDGLSQTEREKLSQTIYYLKQRGVNIETSKARSKKTGKAISVYKLKNL